MSEVGLYGVEKELKKIREVLENISKHFTATVVTTKEPEAAIKVAEYNSGILVFRFKAGGIAVHNITPPYGVSYFEYMLAMLPPLIEGKDWKAGVAAYARVQALPHSEKYRVERDESLSREELVEI